MKVYKNYFTDDLGTKEDYLENDLATQQLLGILINSEGINPEGTWQPKIEFVKNALGYEINVTYCNGASSKYLVR